MLLISKYHSSVQLRVEYLTEPSAKGSYSDRKSGLFVVIKKPTKFLASVSSGLTIKIQFE